MEQLRQDIASSRPVQTKGCCMETTMNNASPGQIRQGMSKAKRYIFVVYLAAGLQRAKRVGCYKL